MRTKLIIGAAIVGAVAVILLVTQASTNSTLNDTLCCKKAKPSCDKQEKVVDDVIMENLSRQFINVSAASY